MKIGRACYVDRSGVSRAGGPRSLTPVSVSRCAKLKSGREGRPGAAMSDQAGTGGGGGLAQLADACVRSFGADWSAEAARRQHQLLEQCIEQAEALGQPAVADAALALAVYLCSFVESETPPDAAARPRIAALAAALASADSASAASVAESGPLVVQLAPPSPFHLELAAALGRRRCLVAQAEDLPALGRLLERRSVDLLLLGADWLAQAAEVIRLIERCSRGRLVEPGCVAWLPEDDAARRLFALRAGVDRVLHGGAPEAIAEALAEFVQERRRTAFRVLVVEDDRGQALFAQAVLRHRGISTRIAGSAAEAIAALPEFAPDLVLLDLHLPDRNGLEVAQLMRERPDFDHVQIVFLSGEPSMEEHFRAIRLGGDDWVAKPVKPRHLLAVIDSRAERARRLRLGGLAGLPARGRRELLDRAAFLDQLQRVQRTGRQPVALLAIAPLVPPRPGEGIDFVLQERLSEEITGRLLALSTLTTGLCRPEPFLFLCLVYGQEPEQDPDLLGERLAVLRQDLGRQRWGSAQLPVSLDFALAAVAAEACSGPPEAWLSAVLRELDAARRQSPHCRLRLQPAAPQDGHDPLREPLRRLFGAGGFDSGLRLRYQPLLPIRGHLPGQFRVLVEFAEPGSGPPRLLPGARCRAYADASGAHLALDCWLLGAALAAIREGQRFGNERRLWVPISCASAVDERFAAWLRTELTRCEVPGGSLTLLLDGGHSLAQVEHGLRLLSTMAVKVAVGPLADQPEQRALARFGGISAVLLEAGATGLDVLIAQAREHGQFVLLDGVDQVGRLAELFARGEVHWVAGPVVAPLLDAPEFEFPPAAD